MRNSFKNFACAWIVAAMVAGPLLGQGIPGAGSPGGGSLEQVTSQLCNGELVVGHVAVQGPQDPIAPGPYVAIAVYLVTVRIGVTGKVCLLYTSPRPRDRG